MSAVLPVAYRLKSATARYAVIVKTIDWAVYFPLLMLSCAPGTSLDQALEPLELASRNGRLVGVGHRPPGATLGYSYPYDDLAGTSGVCKALY